MTSPRTVLHLVNRLDAGGVLRYVTDLADGLRSHGYESRIAAWTPSGSPLHDDSRFTYLPLYTETGARKSPVGALAAIRALRRLCAGQRVDIVHMHSRYALLLGRCAGTPSQRVYTAHNMFPDSRGLSLYPHTVIAPSPAVADSLSAQLGRPDRAGIHVIPHGVELPPDSPAAERPAADSPAAERPAADSPAAESEEVAVFAWIGRLEEEKGLSHVLDAFSECGRSDGPPLRLEVIGDGSRRSDLEQVCSERGLGERVRFHGWHADPFAALPAVRALLFTSLGLDSFPYVNLEAMARGIPVIASDLSVLDTLVLHGETGLRYPAGSAAALSVLLRRAAESPQRMRALGVAAREHIARNFTRERMLRETAAVYGQLFAR